MITFRNNEVIMDSTIREFFHSTIPCLKLCITSALLSDKQDMEFILCYMQTLRQVTYSINTSVISQHMDTMLM
jgi:hypothetical protein